MPLKLVPPQEGRSKNWRIRGTYLGISLNETCGTPSKALAQKLLERRRRDIERGAVARPGELTFAAVALAHLDAGGEARFLGRLNERFGDTPTREIDQAAVDAAAVALYPRGTAATRNRQVYAPMSQILKRAGVREPLIRPRGAAGNARHVWLAPAQVEALLAAAAGLDGEFALLLLVCVYTGLRLSEALRIRVEDVHLAKPRARGECFAFCGRTKNGLPRAIHLVPRVVAALRAHPRGLERQGRLFRWTKGGALYLLAERAYAAAGVDHHGAPFHVLRHTYGAAMTRVGADLVATDVWRSPAAARIYQHFVVNEEARKADLLPGASGPTRAKLVR